MEALDLAQTLSNLALEKKARQPRLLATCEITSYTDYVLLMTATSDRHARALADHLVGEMKLQRVRPLGLEGYETGQWVLLDFGGVVVHILQETTREYYDLDGLWSDAQVVAIEEAG